MRSNIIHQQWVETIQDFLKFTPEQRLEIMRRHLDQCLEELSRHRGISTQEAYALLLENQEKIKNAHFKRKINQSS